MTLITIIFIGGPHDGDERIITKYHPIFYRTGEPNDESLFVTNTSGKLFKYVRSGDSNIYNYEPKPTPLTY